MEHQKEPIKGIELTKKLNHEFSTFFKSAIGVANQVRGYRFSFVRHFLFQLRAARKRALEEKKGTHVPPFLIYSVTRKCNLNCKGCYSRHLHLRESSSEFSITKAQQLFSEADDLGISVIMLAGGEPLMKEGLIEATARYPRILFPLFTNGLLIDEAKALKIREKRNLIPIVSLEGEISETDTRRGEGVHKQIQKTFEILRKQSVLFGASITVTRLNFELVTEPSFVNELIKQGIKVIFYIEYIPCEENTDQLVLTAEQRKSLAVKLDLYRSNTGILFISFPGDEEIFGGCLAAGRGFVHIGSSGSVEPCPFSPYSDVNLRNLSLKSALQSPFLEVIRKNHHTLTEHQGGCALWENREWVDETLKSMRD